MKATACARAAGAAALLRCCRWSCKSDFVLTILVFSFLLGMLAVSFNLIFGYTGQLSMFHAAAFGISAYATYLSMTHWGTSFWTGMLLAAALVLVLSVIVGTICFRFRLKEFYFAVVTLAFSEMARLVVLNWNSVTNGTLGIILQEKPTLWLPGQGVVKLEGTLMWYYVSLVALALTVIVCLRLVNSWMGRCFAAIRLNDELGDTLGHQRVPLQARRVRRRQHHRGDRGRPLRLLPRLDRARLPVDRPVARHRGDGAAGRARRGGGAGDRRHRAHRAAAHDPPRRGDCAPSSTARS